MPGSYTEGNVHQEDQPMSGDPSYGGGLGQRGLQMLVALVVGAIAIGFILVRGAQEGPFGRRQFVTLNPQQEVALGVQAYQEVLSNASVVRSGPVADDVKRVTDRLVRATRNTAFSCAAQ